MSFLPIKICKPSEHDRRDTADGNVVFPLSSNPTEEWRHAFRRRKEATRDLPAEVAAARIILRAPVKEVPKLFPKLKEYVEATNQEIGQLIARREEDARASKQAAQDKAAATRRELDQVLDDLDFS